MATRTARIEPIDAQTPLADQLTAVIAELGEALDAERLAHRRLMTLTRRVAVEGERQRQALS